MSQRPRKKATPARLTPAHKQQIVLGARRREGAPAQHDVNLVITLPRNTFLPSIGRVQKGKRLADVEVKHLARVVTTHKQDPARAHFIHAERRTLVRVCDHFFRLEDNRVVEENGVGLCDAEVVHQLAPFDGHDVVGGDFATGRDGVEDAEWVVVARRNSSAHADIEYNFGR